MPATRPSPSAASESTCPTGSWTHGRTPPGSVQRSMRPRSPPSATEPPGAARSPRSLSRLSAGLDTARGPSSQHALRAAPRRRATRTSRVGRRCRRSTTACLGAASARRGVPRRSQRGQRRARVRRPRATSGGSVQRPRGAGAAVLATQGACESTSPRAAARRAPGRRAGPGSRRARRARRAARDRSALWPLASSASAESRQLGIVAALAGHLGRAREQRRRRAHPRPRSSPRRRQASSSDVGRKRPGRRWAS